MNTLKFLIESKYIKYDTDLLKLSFKITDKD